MRTSEVLECALQPSLTFAERHALSLELAAPLLQRVALPALVCALPLGFVECRTELCALGV